MAQPYRSTVTIAGVPVQAVSTEVDVSTTKDALGMPELGSLFTKIGVWVDMHDGGNAPFTAIAKLFALSNIVTKEKIVEMKVELWRDDNHDDAICSFSFEGWISRFRAANPLPGAEGPNQNHLLYLELEPKVDEANYKHIQIGN